MTSKLNELEALKIDQAKPVEGQDYKYRLSLKDVPAAALARVPPAAEGTNEDVLVIFIGKEEVYQEAIQNDPPREIEASILREKLLDTQGVHDVYYVIWRGGVNEFHSEKEKYFITL